MPSSSTNDPREGTLLENRYTVRRRIARGGSATVYEGIDERLDRPVALKIMHPHLADDSSFVRRAQREAKSAARLQHPNVVSVLDQGHTREGELYLVLEYVSGPTLREIIAREAPLSPRRTLDLLIPVLRGLGQAHRIGLIHRDVKPENVLLTEDGQVKVADFGLMRAVDEHTASATVLGTVGYAAPELVGDGPVDQRSDVYAVGIMAYEMLTGSRPYTGTALQVVNAHVSRDVPAPSGVVPGVPPTLDEFVLRATARDASRRPVDAAALLDLALAIRRSLPAPQDPPSLDTALTQPLSALDGDAARAESAGEAPTEVFGTTTRHGDEMATEAFDARNRLGSASDSGTLGDGAPGGEAATEALGTAERTATIRPDPYATRVMGTPRSGPPTSPILPSYDPEATGTTTAVGARAGRQSGSTARRSPETPRVRLNPNLPPLHVAVAVILFALLLTVAGFLGWWLGSAPGTASATVPAVAGQDAASAERALNAAGISNVGVRSTTSRDAPEGTVISTDPAASASVRGIEQVNLLVSEGPARVDVPTFTGFSADAARTAVTDAGLTVGTVTSTYSTQAVDTVVSQSPAAGASVDEGTAVDLTVAADSPQGDPPNVVGQSEEEARSTLEAKGYTVEVSAPVGSHLHRVVSQREEGDTVFLTVL